MQEQKRLSSLLDYAGIASLGTAIISLIAISAFSQILPEPILFKIFYGAMSLAITNFLISRLIDITHVISQTPSPKMQRASVQGEVANRKIARAA